MRANGGRGGAFPGARRALFARYHIGGCQSCGFSPGETLAEVCARCHGKGRDPRHVVLARRPPILEGGPLPSREAFIETASRGRKGSAMAAWGRALSPAFLGQIYELLRASAGAGGGR